MKRVGCGINVCKMISTYSNDSLNEIGGRIISNSKDKGERFRRNIYEIDRRIVMAIQQKLDQRGKMNYHKFEIVIRNSMFRICLLYTSPSPRDQRGSRMPSSA